jgi:hypothetical protein
MLVGNKRQYVKVGFDNEDELESIVEKNHDILFGPYSIYISQHSIKTPGGTGTVPDAVVINLANNQWFNVEVELGHHGTWQHIAPQVSRQLAAIMNPVTKEKLVDKAIQIVKKSSNLQEAMQELGVADIDLRKRIADTLKNRPLVAIPIDEIPPDLDEWANTLIHEVKIWCIEKFSEKNTGELLYALPDEIPDSIASVASANEVSETKFQGGRLFQELLSHNYLKIGEELILEFGVRGKSKKTFQATVEANGILFEGKLYSPSYAAVACMNKSGSSRRTANGWSMWRRANGQLLDEVYKQYKAERNINYVGRNDR